MPRLPDRKPLAKPKWVLAVDPGDKHVGWSIWSLGEVTAGELDADEAVKLLCVSMDAGRYVGPGMLVIEEFRLYGGSTLGSQVWSPMLTAEMIGALKHAADTRGVPWVEQGAMIKKGIRAQMRARGIENRGRGLHAKDANAHLWYYLLRNQIATKEETK